ncbi:MAG: Arm DNA-binding domain-containing protein [Hyphomicrobium sp.]
MGQKVGQHAAFKAGDAMARFIHKLSVVKINALRKPGYYSDGGGLFFRVRSGGSRSWIFRFTVAGRKRDAGLARYPAVGLAQAREEAARHFCPGRSSQRAWTAVQSAERQGDGRRVTRVLSP